MVTGRVSSFLALACAAISIHAAAPDVDVPISWDIPAGNIWQTIEAYKLQASARVRVRCNYCSGPQACSSDEIGTGSCIPQCPRPQDKIKRVNRVCSLPCEALDAITTRAVSGDLPLLEALTRMLKGTGVTFAVHRRSGGGDLEIVLLDEKRHFDIPAGPTSQTAGMFTAQSGVRTVIASKLYRQARTGAVRGYLTPDEALEIMLRGTGLAYVPFRDFGEGIYVYDESPQVLVLGRRADDGVEALTAPKQSVEQEEMKRSAYASVQEALNTLTLASRGGPSEVSDPGGNFGRGASVNLRGLGPRATLVLINGQRQATSGANGDFVDVSSIPWAAVRRIEVLPDGTSALYGSDAIAGVVNIILQDDLVGAETHMHLASSSGGGDEALIGQLFGARWSTGKLFTAYQYTQRDILPASARSYTASSDKTRLGGSNYSSPFSNPGNLLDLFTGIPTHAIPRDQDGTSLSVSSLESGTNLQNRMSGTDLLPRTQLHSIYLSATQSLGSRLDLHAEGRFSKRDILQHHYAAEGLLAVPRTNAFFPRDLEAPVALISYSFLDDLGPVRARARTNNYAGTLAVTADLGKGWTASISRSQAREALRWHVSNQVDFATLAQALADSNPSTAFNPFGEGSHTPPQTLEEIEAVDAEGVASRVATMRFVADGPVAELPSGDAELAAGFELRKESLRRETQGIPSFDRNVDALFAELAIPFFGKLETQGPARLQVSLAGRGERQSDGKARFNPRLGFQALFARSLKFRGSWGTSFSAPHLADLHDASMNHAGLVSVSDPQAPEGESVVLVQQGNNPTLREESARTWTAGVDWAPQWSPGLTFSFTYYDISYRDRILALPPTALGTVLVDAQWTKIITRNPDSGVVETVCATPGFLGDPAHCMSTPIAALVDARPQNLSTLVMRGIDLNVTRTRRTEWGEFRFSFAGSYILKMAQGLSSFAPTQSIVDTVGSPPSRRARATLDWSRYGARRTGFGAGMAVDYSGSYGDDASRAHPAIEASLTADLQATYRFGADHLFGDAEIALSVNDVFNQNPPFVDREMGYDAFNARPYGRVFGAFVRKSW